MSRAPRCGNCQKLASMSEPRVSLLDLIVDADGLISGQACIVRPCTKCNQDLKEAALPFSGRVDLSHQVTCLSSGLDVLQDKLETTIRAEKVGLYDKTFFGFKLKVTVYCGCGDSASTEFNGEMAASEMECLE